MSPQSGYIWLGSEFLGCSLSVEHVWGDRDCDFHFFVSFPDCLVVQQLGNRQDLTEIDLSHPSGTRMTFGLSTVWV